MTLLSRLFCGKQYRELAKRQLEIDGLRAQITRLSSIAPFFFSEAPQQIHGNELRNVLRDAFPAAELKLADAEYKYVSIEEIKRFLAWDTANERTYRVNEYDCDDYALQLMAHFRSVDGHKLGNSAFGIAWGNTASLGYHAFNITYDGSRIVFIEPQTDELWSYKDNKINGKKYEVDFIMM